VKLQQKNNLLREDGTGILSQRFSTPSATRHEKIPLRPLKFPLLPAFRRHANPCGDPPWGSHRAGVPALAGQEGMA